MPRSNGPTFALVIAAIENGAPSNGPAKYTFPGVYARTLPTPAPTRVWPISLAAGQEGSVSSCAPLLVRASAICASEQNGTPERFAVKPAGSCVANPVISCSPSLRAMWMFIGL